ncbi:MAG: methionyl-tRNA formyltransferase, partial [bacterium]|nr:methionyl-tRNA formyltransferase [bacterium]
FTPAPGAWTLQADGARLKLGPVSRAESAVRLAPGELSLGKNEVLVGTGDGAARLGQVAPAGKSWMDAAAWGRGLREKVSFVVGNEEDA